MKSWETKGQSVWLGEVAQQSFQAQADVPFGPSQNDSLTWLSGPKIFKFMNWAISIQTVHNTS